MCFPPTRFALFKRILMSVLLINNTDKTLDHYETKEVEEGLKNLELSNEANEEKYKDNVLKFFDDVKALAKIMKDTFYGGAENIEHYKVFFIGSRRKLKVIEFLNNLCRRAIYEEELFPLEVYFFEKKKQLPPLLTEYITTFKTAKEKKYVRFFCLEPEGVVEVGVDLNGWV
jgi:hypothetical protein